MRQPGEDGIGRPRLDDPPGIHDVHGLGDRGDHAEVVGDQEQRHAGLVRDLADQLQDLRLDGDVERGRWLVGDQQLRPSGQRHGDHHPLALAARQLVRVEIGREARRIEPDPLHRPPRHASASARPTPTRASQTLGDLSADGVDRVEGRHRLLKDHADLGPSDPAVGGIIEPDQIPISEDDLASDACPIRAAGP